MNASSLTMFNAQRMPRKIFYHVNKWASNKNTSHRFYFDVRLLLEECRIVKSNVQHIQSVKSRQELWILLSAGKCVCLSLHLCTKNISDARSNLKHISSRPFHSLKQWSKYKHNTWKILQSAWIFSPYSNIISWKYFAPSLFQVICGDFSKIWFQLEWLDYDLEIPLNGMFEPSECNPMEWLGKFSSDSFAHFVRILQVLSKRRNMNTNSSLTMFKLNSSHHVNCIAYSTVQQDTFRLVSLKFHWIFFVTK